MADKATAFSASLVSAGTVALVSASLATVFSAGMTSSGTANGVIGLRPPVEFSASMTSGGAVAGSLQTGTPFRAVMRSGGAAELSSANKTPFQLSMTSSGQVAAFIVGQGLLVRDAVLAAARLLQSGCACDLPDDICLQGEILFQVNACLQTIYGRADRLGYFSRKTVTLAFTSGNGSKAFDEDIQAVLGPVRLETGNITLREVTDRAQFDQFSNIFYGTDVPAAPRAYHLQSLNSTGSDNVALTLFVTPTPAAGLNVLADVATEAPRYTWTDATHGTPLSLPHKYAESILLPLVREWATSHEFFAYKDLLPAIKQQADTARQMLGLVDAKKPKSAREDAAYKV